ncbi:MAG TPA: DUF177 domain-containing protein [Patescibacteria group bacterium]|nr:DUF177 domain-containing protein [Patescibacteria group bacterium]
MRINLNQIGPDGFLLNEVLNPKDLDLETELVTFSGPVAVKGVLTKITNAVTADLSLTATVNLVCSRCLEGFKSQIEKKVRLSYDVDKTVTGLDLGPDIRQEFILDYPLKPLCRPACKGLCPVCGKNRNESACSCKA